MADFGNPLVLGGNFDVLSTEIFFAIVGAQNDPGRAAIARARAALLHALGLLRPALLARPPLLHHRVGQGRRRHAPAAAPSLPPLSLRRRRGVGGADPRRLRHHPLRELRQALGRRLHPDPRPLPHRLRHRMGRLRPPLARLGLGLLLDDDLDRARLRAAHRRRRPADRLAPRPPATSPSSAPSSSGRCSPSPSPAR